MSAQRCGGWATRAGGQTANLEHVQAALSGLAGVAMGFPGALEELANLCRERGITRVQGPGASGFAPVRP